MARTDERFIGRWSRLKQKRRRREPGPGDVPKDESARPEPADAQPAPAEEETAPLDLPDIETLDKDSDFTVFMKEGVPEELKKLALRKLWRSDPVFAVIDGLDDYDEDYRIIPEILGEFAKRGDETSEDPDAAVAEAKAKDDEDEAAAAKDDEDEAAAAKDDEEPGEVGAAGERKVATGADADADAEVGEGASESANDADGKSG